jgi:hypothetical protein
VAIGDESVCRFPDIVLANEIRVVSAFLTDPAISGEDDHLLECLRERIVMD